MTPLEETKKYMSDFEEYENAPLEALRFFCSLALSSEDWLDSEELFDAVEEYYVSNRNNGN